MFKTIPIPRGARRGISMPRGKNFGCFQYGRFVATCGHRFTSQQSELHEDHFKDDPKNHFEDDLAFSKKSFAFAKKMEMMLIWHFRRNRSPSREKMWEIISHFERAHICCSVLILVPPF